MRMSPLFLAWFITGAAVAFAQPIPPLQGYPPTAVIVEGDIILPYGPGWPESGYCGTAWIGGDVRYHFDSNVGTGMQTRVRNAMNDLEAVCGVDFIETSLSIGPHIVVRLSTGNNSPVGMQLLGQSLNLSLFANKAVIIHELLHAMGFVHEQSRPDRDNFVQIQFQNVDQNNPECGGSCNHNFDIRSCASTGGPYDFDSVMHYGQDDFSVNGQPTILCLPPFAAFQSTIGQRAHLSIQDATAAATRYGAPPVPTLTSVVHLPVPAGSGEQRIRVFGTRFFEGSADGNGVLGSQVTFNGTPVPTEFVSTTELVGTVPDELLAVPGVFQVAVLNAFPAGGFSGFVNYTVAEGFRKFMLTEVSWGDVEGVEICNFDTVAQSLQGWKVRWKHLNGTAQDSFSPGNVVIQPGQIVMFLDPFLASVAELPNNILRFSLPTLDTTNQAFSVALLDANDTVIDEVRITNAAGDQVGPDLGGRFKGYARRGLITTSAGAVGIERIWGLDSGGGSDWTEQPDRSFGLENRSSGLRGSDAPFGFFSEAPRVIINEIDDGPDYVEIINAWTYTVNLNKFYFLVSASQNNTPTVIRPFPFADVLPGRIIVLGETSTPPIEMPSSATYINVTTLGFNFPLAAEEYSIGLYGPEGALIDLVRTTGTAHVVVHNRPRLPSAWDDFAGAAGRNANNGDGAIGRDPFVVDSNRGSDWRPVYRRTMGSISFATNLFAGPAGLGDQLDVRINTTSPGGGTALIVNAGTAMAGKQFTLLSSYTGHSNGTGPIMGLAFDALLNWVLYHNFAPWGATLDARGSYRFDLPAGTLPPFDADHLAFLTDPATGAVLRQTKVLEEDQ